MPTYVDTHAHLDDPQFDADRAAVLSRAEAVGVTKVVTIGTTAASSRRAVELAGLHPQVFACVGIQPNHAAEAVAGDWDEVVALADQPRVLAIGETGLDRHWDFTPFPIQEDYFARHMELARKKDLPLVIHCREAEADVVRMLRAEFEQHGAIRGVMHSFTGDWPTAAACLAMGLHLSFAGMLTYKNAENLRQVAAQAPLDRLLIETDCPYLTPVPLRGKLKRNEPGHVIHTGTCLAVLRGISPEELAHATTRNARSLFRLPG